MKCRYRLLGKSNRIVFIEDDNGIQSITNDAEAVLQHFKELDPYSRVVYKGTDGVCMEIVEQDGWSNIGFAEWHGLAWDVLKRDTNT